MHLNNRLTALLMGSIFCLSSQAQLSRLGEDVQYGVSLSGQAGDGDYAPFWQTANRYGLGNHKNNSGYGRAYLKRDTENDSLYRWRMGYAVDLVAPIHYTSKFIVQQAYFELQIWDFRMSLGQKERPAELKNNLLSTGGMTMGTNARPIPQLRLEFPDFFFFKKTGHWLGLKGHLAYGKYTDNRWQRDFNAGDTSNSYTSGSFYHSKGGFLRIGDVEKFPLQITGGVEMVCQFGGKEYNVHYLDANGHLQTVTHNKTGVKEFLQALVPTGSDATDTYNPNVMGNHLGSYMARLDYIDKKWKASFYAEHFFEDHSQMGFTFSWKDMLYGLELSVPENPVVTTLLYEHMGTTHQSGPVFKDTETPLNPWSIGGDDNFYNHLNYGAYQHAGHVMGNPMILSPIYNTNHRIFCYDNRIKAHHAGIMGQPHRDLTYRALYTHERSWGTYRTPHANPKTGQFWMVEATYKPERLHGFGITASYGQNHGELLGNSKGGMLTVSYSGWLNKTY